MLNVYCIRRLLVISLLQDGTNKNRVNYTGKNGAQQNEKVREWLKTTEIIEMFSDGITALILGKILANTFSAKYCNAF